MSENTVSVRTYQIYTDGACAGNPGPGGWGVIILDENGQETVLSGGAKSTTNNIMEMTAVIEALSSLKNPSIVQIHSDSQYVIKGMTVWVWSWLRNSWRKSDGQPVLNKELWQKLLNVAKPHRVKWIWVKGHHTDVYNNRCDALAVNESLKYKRKEMHSN